METPDPDLSHPAPEEPATVEALASLAHPLRMRLLGLLRVFGPSTATRLAQRCGISSGLASYHLRHLAGGGLIALAPAPEGAHGREKWWAATSRTTSTGTPATDPEGQAVAAEFSRAALEQHHANASRWVSLSHRWPREWVEASSFTDVALQLTPQQMRALGAELAQVIAGYPQHDPGAPPVPGAAVVTVQSYLYPYPEQDAPGPG